MESQVKSVILLVDDQDTIRFFLEKTLTQEGYEAVTAKTGAEAIEKARQVMPDLVLLDLKLPDMDGLEVLRKIKEIFRIRRHRNSGDRDEAWGVRLRQQAD